MKYFAVAIVVLWMIIFKDVTSAEVEACRNYTEQDTCCNANCTWSTCKETNITDAKCVDKSDYIIPWKTCVASGGSYTDSCALLPTTTPQVPTTTESETTSTENKPTTTENKSTTIENKPTTTENKPTTTESETSTENKPTTTENKQTTTHTLTTTPPGRHFDGASFVGGIILSAGLSLIAIFAYKFCTNIRGKSYRTLKAKI